MEFDRDVVAVGAVGVGPTGWRDVHRQCPHHYHCICKITHMCAGGLADCSSDHRLGVVGGAAGAELVAPAGADVAASVVRACLHLRQYRCGASHDIRDDLNRRRGEGGLLLSAPLKGM